MPEPTDPNIYKIRPNSIEFLEELKNHYEIVIYSSRKFTIVHQVAELLDPKGQIFSQVLSRRSCHLTNTKKFLKDIKLVKNRNSKNMLIIDYKPQSFALSLENGVILLHWNGDEFDDQLMGEKLDYLIKLSKEYSCSYKNSKMMDYCQIFKGVLGGSGFVEIGDGEKKRKVVFSEKIIRKEGNRLKRSLGKQGLEKLVSRISKMTEKKNEKK